MKRRAQRCAQRYTINDNIIKCPYIRPEYGIDIGKKQIFSFSFSNILNSANYLLGYNYTFTDEEMLEQFYCMLDGNLKTKLELKDTLERAMLEFRKSERILLLFKTMIMNMDRLLNVAIKDGVFIIE
jgi:hypothetical protein